MSGITFIMLACLTWALDTLIRYPLLHAGFSALQIVLLEHVTLVLVTLPWLWRYRQQYLRLGWIAFGSLFMIGGVGSALGTLAFTQAFHYLNPTVVILLQKLQPLIAIGLASYFLNESIRGSFLCWAGIILLGSLVMMWPDLRGLTNQAMLGHYQWMRVVYGYGYTLLAVVAWGCATVCGKYLSRQSMHENAIVSGRFVMGLAVLIPLAWWHHDRLVAMDAQQSMQLIGMVLLSGLCGMWLYYKGLKRIPAQVATLAEQTFPIFAGVVNWLFLDKSLTSYQLIGALILIVGNFGVHINEVYGSRHTHQTAVPSV